MALLQTAHLELIFIIEDMQKLDSPLSHMDYSLCQRMLPLYVGDPLELHRCYQIPLSGNCSQIHAYQMKNLLTKSIGPRLNARARKHFRYSNMVSKSHILIKPMIISYSSYLLTSWHGFIRIEGRVSYKHFIQDSPKRPPTDHQGRIIFRNLKCSVKNKERRASPVTFHSVSLL